jgi:hypothetical protein
MFSLDLKKMIFLCLTVCMIIAPLVVSAGGLIPCGNTFTGIGPPPADAHECTFTDVITLIQNIINYIITIAAPIATIMFTYAGVEYVTAAGNTGKIAQAHRIFWTVFVGFCIMLAAWLIVKSVSVLVDPSFSTLLGN